MPYRRRACRSRYAYAQDTHGRDLFLKLIGKDSVECDTNKYLLDLDELHGADTFPCVMPPVAVLDTPHDFSFLAMPLWTDNLEIVHNFGAVCDILRFIECTLTGLSFLHDHRVAHRDISDHNMLVNCYCPDVDASGTKEVIQQHIRENKSVTYCLFDFSMSIRFPSDTNIRTACRPSTEAWNGSPKYHPSDYWRGKPTYNPFAFDVACLGNVFLYFFSHAIPTVPALAPLFARMTTWDADQRFTAQEALRFYHDHLANLPELTLATELLIIPGFNTAENPDLFWQLLPVGEQKRWERHRVPPKPWGHKLLEWIATFEYGWDFLYAIRNTLHV
ncbi:kinase-like domain-containing protein [Trametes elegans]|nr:kinase-like domain-containing protein [Trametes elegans]